ncbi:inorganic phosphate transporter [Bacillota bacterium LX-D]|nr:inorganic phosphate transporter [Bacillota bacterium LX-D]
MNSNIMIIVIIVVFIALIFALTNGLHDASSVVATMIACGAATPLQAIGLASFFCLLGALLTGNAVANTIAKIVTLPLEPSLLPVLMAAMAGAVVWNLITWHFGLPSSSTHALVGGLIGAVWVSGGPGNVLWGFHELLNGHLTGIMEVCAALIISPLLGFGLALILQTVLSIALRNAEITINSWLKRLQWVMAGLLAYSHGGNDTQKIMGIITLALMAVGLLQEQVVPQWVKWLGGIIMFAGTLFGGWSIMKTLGYGIYDLRPIHSLNSQIASGSAIVLATFLGAPVSTTHVVVGTVLGVGTADRYKMVNWNIGKDILVAWFITIPSVAFVAALCYYPLLWFINLL